MMKDVERALGEMGELLCGCGIDSVYQIDAHTFVLNLFGRKIPGDLLVSVRRRSGRFHLIFERIHREYHLRTHGSTLLEKYLSRCRVRSIHVTGEHLQLGISGNSNVFLLVDFGSGNLSLLDENGRVVFELQETLKPQPVMADGSADLTFSCSGDDSGAGRTFHGSSLTFNRKLSGEFILQQNQVIARRVLPVLRTERKKVQRLIEKLSDEQREVQEKELYRMKGELLKYHLQGIEKGAVSVVLTGFNGDPVEVDLDPLLSPQENMNRYFNWYKKLKRREEVLGHKMSFERRRLAMLGDLLERVQGGSELSITDSPTVFIGSLDTGVLTVAFQEKIRRLFYPKEKGFKGDVRAESFLRFTSRTGKIILVGRNARENDELTLRRARGNDLWFHVETGPGSHVILRYERQGVFQDSDIVDAAMLALYFSPNRRNRGGNVVYAYRKNVRKLRGSPPGTVTFHSNRTKHILFDDAVLGRLLDSRPPGMIMER